MRFLPLALLLSACAGDDKDTDTDTDVETDTDTDTDADSDADTDTDADTDVEDARIRVMHLAPDVGVVDVFVDDGATPAFPDADFTDGTDYADLPPGTYDFDVSLDGDPATSPALTLGATLDEGVSYAAVAHGYAGGEPAAALTAFVENSDDVPADTTRIHIVHAAADVGQVDVYDANDTSAALVSDLDYGADAADLDITPGALVVGIDVDDDPGTLEFTFDVPDLGNQYVSVYAVNRQATDGGPLDLALVAHLADGTTATLEPIVNDILSLTFDDKGSIKGWNGLADAATADATIAWNAAGGNPGGALDIAAVNSTLNGRAYIFEFSTSGLDFSESSDISLTFDLKLGAPLVGTAVQLQTELPGVGAVNNFNLENGSGLNDKTWTPFNFDFKGVDTKGDTFRIHFNLAAGAFKGAGGGLLVDNVVLNPTP
ncbi:MAG: DUF4397 domain-containing protein [Myxococcales bacterium]|nr:DUF4397 domain-containing protein [Myxococcales bacterium]